MHGGAPLHSFLNCKQLQGCAAGANEMDDHAIESDEGWAVRFLTPDLLEYRHGRVACLVNMGYSTERHATEIYATESASLLAPHLREHLQKAAQFFRGRYVIV